jgi:hypothetical protein
MSTVTDLVFVTPSSEAAERFADRFERAEHGFFGRTKSTHSWRPVPVQSNGGKASGTYVFHLGVNHIDSDLVDDLKAMTWPVGTVLYTWCVDVMTYETPEPEVTTW